MKFEELLQEREKEGRKEERVLLAELTKCMKADGNGDKVIRLLEDDDLYKGMLVKYNLKY